MKRARSLPACRNDSKGSSPPPTKWPRSTTSWRRSKTNTALPGATQTQSIRSSRPLGPPLSNRWGLYSTTLGDERYADYQRSRDPVYRTISQAGNDVGASPDAINQAYAAQKQVQSSVQQVMQDPTLSPDQRAQQLVDIRAQAQQSLQQVFGDKAGQIMQRLPEFQMAQRYGIVPGPVARASNPETLRPI